MKFNSIQSCHLGPEISPEQFVSEHFFIYLIKGSIEAYDGYKSYQIHPGECCIVRKHHLVRYVKHKHDDAFEKTVIVLDESFLRSFLEKHSIREEVFINSDSFLPVESDRFILNFIQSLAPYYDSSEKLDATFADLKREELLLILLKKNPLLAGMFFNFNELDKIDIEEFMNKSFRFNISLERFAFLTGRSLSSFKREFQKIFHDTPGRWLTHKRLQEAYFLIENENRKASEIYLDLGFEDLSHFSFAFKKQFGQTPAQLLDRELD